MHATGACDALLCSERLEFRQPLHLHAFSGANISDHPFLWEIVDAMSFVVSLIFSVGLNHPPMEKASVALQALSMCAGSSEKEKLSATVTFWVTRGLAAGSKSKLRFAN